MFAVTGGSARHAGIIRLWEQRVIACGLTPVIYDIGGLGYGRPSLASPDRPSTIEKALADLDGHFFYTDPDAIFRGVPTQLVGDWPVAVTVRPKSQWAKADRIDAGVMYLSDGPDCQEFIKLWWSLTARVGDDQRALNMLLADVKRTGFVTVHSADCEIKVQSFPTELYNCPVGDGIHRAVVVRAGETPPEEVPVACGLTHGVVKPGGVYETFASDADYQLSRFVKEKDSPAPAFNVTPGVYEGHPEAVIVSCFYNPQNNPYRLIAFQKFYRSIKHLNFRIVECLIGKDAKPQLPDHPNITRVYADDLIWHKETLLNMAVAGLPPEFKYVFVLDADVLFTNPKWMVDGVAALQEVGAIQPFEYCIHLEKNRLEPTFDPTAYEAVASDPEKRHPSMWRSFSSNVALHNPYFLDTCYDAHGHVGFAWGFQRRVLEQCPLFEKALIGGADHILAHAGAGQVPHACIAKSFTANLDEVLEWSKRFNNATYGELGYAPGYLYHIWHGDIASRQYLKRVKEFTGPSRNFVKGSNGLYKLPPQNRGYVNRYYQGREVGYDDFDWIDPTFFEDMGYLLWDIYWMFGQPSFNDETFPVELPPDDVPMPDAGPDVQMDVGQNAPEPEIEVLVQQTGSPIEHFVTGEGQGLTPDTPLDDADSGNFS